MVDIRLAQAKNLGKGAEMYGALSFCVEREVVVDDVGYTIDALEPHLALGHLDSLATLLDGSLVAHGGHCGCKGCISATRGDCSA